MILDEKKTRKRPFDQLRSEKNDKRTNKKHLFLIKFGFPMLMPIFRYSRPAEDVPFFSTQNNEQRSAVKRLTCSV